MSLYAYLVDYLEQPNRALGLIAEDDHNRIEKVIAVPGVSHIQGPAPVGGSVPSSGQDTTP